MTKFKRYIKKIFSIAGLEWRDGKKPITHKDGIILTTQKNETATQRSLMNDEQYMMSIENFATNVLAPIVEDNVDQDYVTQIDPPPNPYAVVDENVGNIPEGTRSTELFGRSVNYILDKIFFVNPPFVALDNGDIMTRTLPVDLRVEVGTTIQFDVNAVHSVGVIASADGTPSVQLVGDADSFTFTDFTGTVTPVPFTTNVQNFIGEIAPALFGNNTVTCDIPYGVGNGAYFWADGVRSLAFEFQRLSGNALVAETILGEYGAFYGSGALASIPTTPAEIRLLPIQLIDQVEGIRFEMTVPFGDVEMYFYVPDIYTVVSVFHNVHSNLFVLPDFIQTPVPMEDGAGVPIGYIEYKLEIGGVGFLTDETYIINIEA